MESRYAGAKSFKVTLHPIDLLVPGRLRHLNSNKSVPKSGECAPTRKSLLRRVYRI